MIAKMFVKTEKAGFYMQTLFNFKHVKSMHASVKFLCNIGLWFLICVLDLSIVQPNTDTEIKDPYSDWLKKDFAMATR